MADIVALGMTIDLEYVADCTFLPPMIPPPSSEVPATVVKPLTDQTTVEKQKTILECEVSRPNVQGKWLRNGEEIKNDDRHRIVVEKTIQRLVISPTEMEDDAEYTFIVGTDETKAKLTVQGTWFCHLLASGSAIQHGFSNHANIALYTGFAPFLLS